MQKKLYFLSEEEKNRIINLHESATKKQYLLSEQKYDNFTPKKTTTTQVSTPAQKKFYDRKERVKTLDGKCSNPTPNDKNPLYKKLGDWMDYTGTGGSWGTGSLEGILKDINSVQQYCEISATLKSKGTPKGRNKESIGEYLLRRIQYMSSWEQYFEKPLKKLLDSVGLNKTENATISNEVWKKYPCVTTTGKKYVLPDGTFVYDLGGYYFYGGGRKMNKKNKEMSDFVCDENDNSKIKDFKPQVVDSQPNIESGSQVIQGIGKVTSNVRTEIPNLLKQVGIEGTDLTQDVINKLYDKLSK